MKHNLYLLLVFLPLCTFAEIKLHDFNGKWQEEKRTQGKKKQIDFLDTIRIAVDDEGYAMFQISNGATFGAEVVLKDKKVWFREKKFTVKDISHSSMILEDDEGRHHFKKVTQFHDSPVSRLQHHAEEGEKNIALQTIYGKWSVYKKTDPSFTHQTFYLNAIEFLKDKGKGTYSGNATFNNSDSIYTTDALIYIKNTDFIISTDDETFKTKVILSDGKELVLQNGKIIYYLKQFAKQD